MVSVGNAISAAAAFTSISIDQFPVNTGRVIQGIITGIGFLGSGIILKAEGDIKGMTTAAEIWSVSAIGVMIGTGEYLMGISRFLVILFVLLLPTGKQYRPKTSESNDDATRHESER